MDNTEGSVKERYEGDSPAAASSFVPDGTVRLISVQRGGEDDPINISLIDIELSRKPRYSCVSFLPSPQDETEEIFRDGGIIRVDSNLASAIRALRTDDEMILIWADDIVINDHSSAKGSHDLSLQNKIALTNARWLIVWLGQGGEYTKKAAELLRALGQEWASVTKDTGLPADITKASPRKLSQVIQQLAAIVSSGSLIHSDALQDPAFISAMDSLTSPPYLGSTQAIRDLVLAPQISVMAANQSTNMSWETYFQALCFVNLSQGVLPFSRDASLLELVMSLIIARRRYREDASGVELLPMLQQARQTTCADPRDKVFALLPLVSPSRRVQVLGEELRPPPQVDYTKSVQDVFIEAARYIITERQDLLLWSSSPAPSATTRPAGLPSWVPDWSDPSTSPTLPLRANMRLRSWSDNAHLAAVKSALSITPAGTLLAQAHFASRITHLSPPFTATNVRALALSQLQALPPTERLTSPDAYSRTLVLGDRRAPAPSFRSLTALAQIMVALDGPLCGAVDDIAAFAGSPAVLARITSDPLLVALAKVVTAADYSVFERAVVDAAVGRRFFVTEAGLLGMTAVEDEGAVDAGKGARVGDFVAVVVGGFFPYVLRECGGGGGGDVGDEGAAARVRRRVELVGEAHVQGLMDGEALKERGWLLSSWKQVEVEDIEIV